MNQNPDFIEEIQHPGGYAAEGSTGEVEPQRLHVDHVAAEHVLIQRNGVAGRKIENVTADPLSRILRPFSRKYPFSKRKSRNPNRTERWSAERPPASASSTVMR